jgi:hypothetical protein
LSFLKLNKSAQTRPLLDRKVIDLLIKAYANNLAMKQRPEARVYFTPMNWKHPPA